MLHVDSTDGVRLALHDLGGDGPAILFAHATGFHGWVWGPLAAAMAMRYHSWSLDYRGHGDSTEPADGSFAWEGFGRDTLAVLAALDLDRPHGMGHSMGGAALAMAELARPGSFRSLVLYEPVLFPSDAPRPDGPFLLAEVSRRRRQRFTSRREAYDNFAAKPPLNTLAPAALRAYVDHGFADEPDGSVVLRCDGEHEARIYEMGPHHHTFERLGELRLPVLVLAGRPEPFRPSDFAAEVARAIPRAHFHRFDDLGHFGPLDEPEEVAAVMQEFLDNVT